MTPAAWGVVLTLVVAVVLIAVAIATIRGRAAVLDQIIGVCFRCQRRPAPDTSLYCTTCRPIVDANPAEPIETADWTDELGLVRQGKRSGDQ